MASVSSRVASLWRDPRFGTAAEYAAAVALAVGALIVFAATQPPLQTCRHGTGIHPGIGWDGESYEMMTEQIAAGHRPTSLPPFIYRVGVPALAAAVSVLGDVRAVDALRAVNIVADVLLAVVLLAFSRMYVRSRAARFLILAAFVTHWASPFRIVFHQIFVDNWALVLVFLLLWLAARARHAAKPWHAVAATLVAFAGAFVREMTVVGALAFAAAWVPLVIRTDQRPWRHRLGPWLAMAAPLIAWWIGFSIARQLVIVTGDYELDANAWTFAYAKPLPVLIHSWCLSAGLCVVVLAYYYRTTFSLLTRAPELGVALVTTGFLAIVGGDSTERFMVWLLPIVFVAVGYVVVRNYAQVGIASLLLLFVAQFLTNRVAWPIPETAQSVSQLPAVVLLPLGRDVVYDQYWSLLLARSYRDLQHDSLIQYAVLGGALLLSLVLAQRGARLSS